MSLYIGGSDGYHWYTAVIFMLLLSPFLFLRQPLVRKLLVLNAVRVKRKLPSLLVDDSTTKKKSWNSLMRYRYRLAQFKKRQPEKFNSIANRIILDLTDLEKAVNESNNSGRRHKTL
jgi:hypothetical protein